MHKTHSHVTLSTTMWRQAVAGLAALFLATLVVFSQGSATASPANDLSPSSTASPLIDVGSGNEGARTVDVDPGATAIGSTSAGLSEEPMKSPIQLWVGVAALAPLAFVLGAMVVTMRRHRAR